jgi:hypothetical protein
MLKQGIVLDVAAGRGMVSIDLCITHDVECVLVDPRDDSFRPSKKQLKQLEQKQISKDNLRCRQLKDHFDDSFSKKHCQVSDSVRFVFGMHPDQATEAIVDYALARSLPFAIVPCCVYAVAFPDRKDSNGNAVVQFQEFVDYLMAKDASIQKAHLPFEGRNLVLFRTV